MLPHPLSPSDEDVDFYKKNLIYGTTLLLGCTHKLINISNQQMDIDPWYNAPTVIIKDWTLNNKKYNNIIGDGVLNFTKDLCDKIIKMCSEHSDVFVARSFNRKLDQMKIASYFPTFENFYIKPKIIKCYKDYSFFVWNF